MSLAEKFRHSKLLSFTLIVFTLSIGVIIGTLVNTGVKAETQAAPGAKPLVVPSPREMQSAFATLAKQLEPSVVHISTTYEAKPAASTRNRRPQAAPDEEDPFSRFFGGNPFGGGEQQRRRGSGTGSGVIVDANGYILTNNHVVDKADRIQVTLFNETTKYEAKLIGTDPESDLAVIKIDARKNLAFAKIGNSDSIQVGDWAVAIGSPFGLQASVTAGIISAKERDLGGREHQFQRFLQTDAAINPGNSGGPLINISGEVIGINTAIATGTGGYQGIGFALPMNEAAKVYNSIIKTGKVSRGAIGVEFGETDPALLSVYGAKGGVFVQRVTPGRPAAKAGLQAEDIIVAINGQQLKDGQDLVARISDMEIGSTATVSIIRDKQKQDLKVTIGDRNEVINEQRAAERNDAEKEGATPAKFGISLQALTDARRDAIGFRDKGGVLVAEITPGSFAEDIGIAPNDIIVSINRQPVYGIEDVRKIQGGLKTGDPVAFRIMRSFGQLRRTPSQEAPEWTSVFLAGTLRDNQ